MQISKKLNFGVLRQKLPTLVYLFAEQAVISEQDGIFQKIVKRAGHNKQAGWNILEYLISEQAEFHRKKDIFN